ncbi:MAG: DivIVA domain-containing protein [Bacillota bacterium]
MKFSPLDIYNKEFKKSTFGYNASEVDEFLDEVGMAYEKILKEVNNLKDKNEKMKEKLNAYEQIENKLERTLKLIEKSVEEEKKRASREAESIKEKAKREAEKIKDKAREEIENEYKKLENLKEQKNLFEIRFKTLLQSHLEMLEDEDDFEKEKEYNVEEDIAVSQSQIDD